MAFNLSYKSLTGQLKNTLSGEISAKKYADSLISGFIVKTDDPKADDIVIDVITKRTVSLKTDFSDEVIDNGAILTQHAVRPPIVFQVEGYIYNEKGTTTQLQQAQNKINTKLQTLDVYAPSLTAGMLTKFNTVANKLAGGLSYVDKAIADGKNLASTFTKLKPTQTPIETITEKLFNIRDTLTPCKVSVFGIIMTMYIERCDIDQEYYRETGKIRVSISYREVKQIVNKYATITKKQFNTLLSPQKAENVNKGITAGKQVNNETALRYGFRKLFGF